MPFDRRKTLVQLRPTRGGIAPPGLGSALTLWLDASDGATLYDSNSGGSLVTSDGAAIGRWEDKSGNARHFTQSTAGDRPTLGASGAGLINGKNSVVFNWAVADNASGSKYLVGPNASNFIPTGTTPATDCHAFFIVHQRIAAAANRQLMQDNTPNWVIWNNAGTPAQIDWVPRSGVTVAGPSLSLDTTYILLVRRVAGTDVRLSVNGGTEVVVSNNQTLTIAGALSFPNVASGFKQKCRMCEIIGHKGAEISLTERNGIGSYLAAKWGTTWTPQT